MSNPDQSNLSEKSGGEVLKDALSVVTAIHQLLQGVARIEQRLAAIESRLSGGSAVRKVADKPNIRNMLIGQLQKGWMSEQEAIERTGWQTIGVRSFVTKLRGLGLSVETEERDGVPHYRIAR